MDFELTDEQQMMLGTLRTMAQRERFAELAVAIDRSGEFPHHLLPRFAEMGLLGMTLSPRYGGGGEPGLSAVLAIEALARFSPAIAAGVFESNVGPVRVIDTFGTEAQKQTLIPGVCEGRFSISVCMTEPGCGSDLTALTTKVTGREGGGLCLTGRKTFITGGGAATHYLVYCRFGDARGAKGVGAVIVAADAPGCSFGKQEEYMGLRGMPSADVIFEDVPLTAEDIVVQPGSFRLLMTTFDLERCGNAAMCLGIAAGAIEEATAFARERRAFGRPICEFQDIQFRVADMHMKLDGARLLVYRAASGAGRGYPSLLESAMAKCAANEMVCEVTSSAMQVMGGYGYSKEFPVERMHRDGLAWRVAGGTVQMLRLTMASVLFGRRFDQRGPAQA